jgi:hypothetical protein
MYLPLIAREDLQRRQRLVEGHFVSALVDTHEAELARLLDLPVHDVVRRRQIGESRLVLFHGIDLSGDGLYAEPVADVIGVAGVEHYGDVVVEQVPEVFDGFDFPTVIARSSECRSDYARGLGIVLKGADGGLDIGRV